MPTRVLDWCGTTAAALPAVLVTAATLTFVVAHRQYGDAASSGPYRNSAEAAAAGDAARVLRFLRMGDDPTRIHLVRPHLISADIIKVTTLEAAMWSRELGMIQLLDGEGGIVDPDQRRDLACLAFDLDLPQVKTYLGPDTACVRGMTLKRLAERSSSEPTNE
jgi:hypothetical protein